MDNEFIGEYVHEEAKSQAEWYAKKRMATADALVDAQRSNN